MKKEEQRNAYIYMHDENQTNSASQYESLYDELVSRFDMQLKKRMTELDEQIKNCTDDTLRDDFQKRRDAYEEQARKLRDIIVGSHLVVGSLVALLIYKRLAQHTIDLNELLARAIQVIQDPGDRENIEQICIYIEHLNRHKTDRNQIFVGALIAFLVGVILLAGAILFYPAVIMTLTCLLGLSASLSILTCGLAKEKAERNFAEASDAVYKMSNLTENAFFLSKKTDAGSESVGASSSLGCVV